MRVYAKDNCSISTGMGKDIPVQMGREKTGEVLIKTSDKTVPGLGLPDIVYSVKRKLGWIFVEYHNPDSIVLKQGQTIGLVMSCKMTPKKQGQAS